MVNLHCFLAFVFLCDVLAIISLSQSVESACAGHFHFRCSP